MRQRIAYMSLIALAFPLLLISFQNCSPGFQGSSEGIASFSGRIDDSSDQPTTTPPDSEPTPIVEPTPVLEPTPGPTVEPGPIASPTPAATPAKSRRLVTIGVGVAGRRVAGLKGFQTILFETANYTMASTQVIAPDPADNTKKICPTDMTFINNACCFSANNCIGAAPGDHHSDFLLRGVAFGNGRFVAVGGWLTGISHATTDGLSWSARSFLDKAGGKVSGALTSATWLSDVAYYDGRFVAVAGTGCVLYESTDGLMWSTQGATIKGGVCRTLHIFNNVLFAQGDGGRWAHSLDGKTWARTGVGSNPTDIVQVGENVYGVVPGKVVKLADVAENRWDDFYVRENFGYLTYNAVENLLHFFGGGIVAKGNSSGTWADSKKLGGPTRWYHFTGEVTVGQVGKSTGWSIDSLTWSSTPSEARFDQTLLDFASGYVETDSP